MKKNHFRTVWISDVHLGSKGCDATALLDFLQGTKADTWYLVGDIIDGWRMASSKSYWPQEHTDVIRKVLSKAKNGNDVIYVTGNHDEFLRQYTQFDLTMGNLQIVDEAIHETADGRQLLVCHGDKYDTIVKYHKWVAFLGDVGYNFLLWMNRYVNSFRRVFGLKYWSLSQVIKHRVKQAVSYITEFEEAVARECAIRDLDGGVFGHIHHAEIREIDNITYHNCGDWVESCTALAEDF